MASYERVLCGPCIHKFDGSPTHKVTELSSRQKCTCQECGKRAYGARCRIDSITDRCDRKEPRDSRERAAR